MSVISVETLHTAQRLYLVTYRGCRCGGRGGSITCGGGRVIHYLGQSNALCTSPRELHVITEAGVVSEGVASPGVHLVVVAEVAEPGLGVMVALSIIWAGVMRFACHHVSYM